MHVHATYRLALIMQCVRACVCACVRACVRARVCVHVSHLEVAKCKSGESSNLQDGYSDQCHHPWSYPPPSSHGSCRPIDEYPTALRGPCSCVDKPCCKWDYQSCNSCSLPDLAVVNISTKVRLESLLPMGWPVLLLPDGSLRAWWL